jgi:membrane-associated phospholipid phosphatase
MNLVNSLHSALGHPEAFWLVLTSLGRDEVFIVVLALYSWLVNPGGMRQLGLAFSLSYLANTLLKFGFNLPRPFTSDPSVASAAAKATATGPGLPSGHTQQSAALWLGMAWQLATSGRPAPDRKQRWFGVLAVVLVVAVSLSRLVLGVHYLADVLAGLLLGVGFAWLAATRAEWVKKLLVWNIWVPLLALLLAAALPTTAPREYSVGLGLLAGFWLLRRNFSAPSSWPARIGIAAAGLLLVFTVYIGLSVLPQALRDLGVVRALKYGLLVLMAGEGVPRLFRTWMPETDARSSVPGVTKT